MGKKKKPAIAIPKVSSDVKYKVRIWCITGGDEKGIKRSGRTEKMWRKFVQ